VSVHITGSEAETTALGREVAARLGPGAVVLLEGPLGAGKTAFVRGLAEGLVGSGDVVSSPTFTIVQEYHGPIMLQHVDLYRLSPVEVDDLALEDLMEDSVLAVEWPDRWRRAPSDAIVISIAHEGGDHRRITIGPRGSFSRDA
jgi:tRNA threonylcarbamoyladenosine biosynthesis protein TsaE